MLSNCDAGEDPRESLGQQEDQTVNPKGNQPWRVIGSTDAEAIWPPDAKNWLIGKDPDVGQVWGQEEKGMIEDEMVGWHHPLNGDKNLSNLRELGWTGRPGVLWSTVLRRVGHDSATQLNSWTALVCYWWFQMYIIWGYVVTVSIKTVSKKYTQNRLLTN